jgi:hypothetical protein
MEVSMLLKQQYQGGDLVIPQQQLELLGVTIGDVVAVEIAKTVPAINSAQKEALARLLIEWQEAWADVDWDDFAVQREKMWQTWKPSTLS